MRKTPGMGDAKSAQLLAATELARRTLCETISGSDALSSPRAVRDYLRLSLASREHEVFVAMMLDAQHRVIAYEELFRGTLTQTSVYPQAYPHWIRMRMDRKERYQTTVIGRKAALRTRLDKGGLVV